MIFFKCALCLFKLIWFLQYLLSSKMRPHPPFHLVEGEVPHLGTEYKSVGEGQETAVALALPRFGITAAVCHSRPLHPLSLPHVVLGPCTSTSICVTSSPHNLALLPLLPQCLHKGRGESRKKQRSSCLPLHPFPYHHLHTACLPNACSPLPPLHRHLPPTTAFPAAVALGMNLI